MFKHGEYVQVDTDGGGADTYYSDEFRISLGVGSFVTHAQRTAAGTATAVCTLQASLDGTNFSDLGHTITIANGTAIHEGADGTDAVVYARYPHYRWKVVVSTDDAVINLYAIPVA